MANELTEPEFKLIRQIDTLHDFWSNQRGDDIQDILLEFPILKDTIESIKGGDLKKNRVTLSGIENSFASYFEDKKKYPAIVDQNDIFTIDPTDTNEKNEENLTNYSKNKALQLVIPHDIDENYDLKYVGEFIRKFMVGDDSDVGFVIDANHGKLPQLFKTDDHVKTVINALVVADSANTPKEHSNSKFYERLTPNIFPTFYQDLTKTSEKATYEVISPFFSSEKVMMYYQEVDKDSFADNITAFKFVVQTMAGLQLGEAYFSPSTTQGASVDTLKQLIQFVNDGRNMNELKNLDYPAKQLDIRPILFGMKQNAFDPNDIINFLLDYKRAGDYEQVNSAKIMKESGKKIIFSTGDELCALYARSKGVPCIYNHAGKMDLYTFDAKQETRDDRLAKYTENLDYYSKYKSFFNMITSSVLADFIKSYLDDLEQSVREKIQAPVVQPFIVYTVAEYRNTLDFEALTSINAILNRIIRELEDKIAEIEANPDFKPENYKLSKAYNEAVNKIQIFLAVVDKIVEQINLNNLKEETVKNFIALQATKIYESDDNIFNHHFDSHALLANAYTNFARDIATEGKIEKIKKKKDDAETNLANLIEKKQSLTDVRELNKIDQRIKAASGTAENEGKALYSALLKYETILMTQVNTMNDEIDKIIKEEHQTFKMPQAQTPIKVASIVEEYQKFINDYGTKLNPVMPMSISQTPLYSDVIYPDVIEGGGYEKEKETIKLWSGLETALLTLSDYSETMFNALYKDFQRDSNEGTEKEFLDYLNYIYSESYKWKEEDDDLKNRTNLRDFTLSGVTFKTVKTDYIKYVNELNGEFNSALNEIMPPESTPKEFYIEIAKILNETEMGEFIELLYNETERDDRKRKRMSGGKGDDDIDLLRLFNITCTIDQAEKKVKRKFKNFDDIDVNTIMTVETFVGGAQSTKRFATAARTVRSIHRTIKAFKDFKGLKQHIIKETDKTNKKTQEKWAKIKELTKPPPTPAEPSPMVSTPSEIETPYTPDVVPDIEDPMLSENENVVSTGQDKTMEIDGGKKNKKLTRKYKNKRNKKTRNKNKKTKKNKTVKKKKNRKQRKTRRN